MLGGPKILEAESELFYLRLRVTLLITAPNVFLTHVIREVGFGEIVEGYLCKNTQK